MTGARLLVRRGAELLAGLVVAALVGGLTLAAVSALPLEEPSWLPEAFVATVAAAFVALAAWLLLRGTGAGADTPAARARRSGSPARRGATGDRGLWLLGTAGPAFLAASHLGAVLHGTPHYLFGLAGDQINRVAYVTRFADSPALRDVFYADTAPFYPPQWFWVGGRIAELVSVDGWEFYKPYAIVTMAIAGAIAFVAWRWLVPARVAVLFGLVTAVVGGHTNAYEPYSWILICLLPQVVVATLLVRERVRARAGGPGDRRADGPAGGPPDDRADGPRTWPLVVTVGVYLGWAALGYTLIAGFAALVVGLVVVGSVWRTGAWRTGATRSRAGRPVALALLGRLAAMAAISAALALVFWHRYLLAVLGGAATEKSVANDFAPESGAIWSLPLFEASAAGLLCLLGTVWLVATLWPRARKLADRGVHELGARVGAPGAVRGGEPGGSRDENRGDDDEAGRSPTAPTPVLPDHAALLLARALGVLAVAVLGWFALSGLRALTGSTLLAFRMIPVITLALALAGVVGALALARWAVAASPDDSRGRVRAVAVVLAALAAVQMVQHVSEEDTAFAAEARAQPGMPRDVLGAIDEMTPGREPSDLVVLTADPTLYAYRPYFTYQAPAQAYAAPTGRYEERLQQIRGWAEADGPRELAAALDAGPVRAPDVFVLDVEDADEAGSRTDPDSADGDRPGSPGTRRAADSWTFPAIINVMPSESNNRREEIAFSPRQFDDPALFEDREVGSRVVIVRR